MSENSVKKWKKKHTSQTTIVELKSFFFFFAGEQTRIYVCIKNDTGEEARGYCSDQDAPGAQKQPCNRHCTIKYNDHYPKYF